MSKVAIVTDSTSSIPQDRIEKHGITIMRQVVIWDGVTYKDGVDITPQAFYERLAQSDKSPTTSQCSVADFKEAFDKLSGEGHDILCIVVSSKLSGTLNSATQAKEMVPDANIEIVDSKQVAMSLGHIVLKAAEVSEAGGSLAECKAAAEALVDNGGVVLTPETLEYLHRGGRIGGGAKFLATALNIKPILVLEDGRLEAGERVRTRKKVMRRLVEMVIEKTEGKSNIRLSALHANSEADAKLLLDMLNEKVDTTDCLITGVSPAVGVHVGPGTVGITFLHD
jgi:DegV family protein with EDD domain